MIDKLSTIELSNELKRLSRKIKTLKSSIPGEPSLPEHYIEKARIEAEISELANRQTTIGELLLERDKQRQKRAEERLGQQAATGAEKAEELLSRLPGFAHKVSVAFKALGEDYAELLELSQNIRKTNMVLLGSNKRQCVHAAVRIEPNNLHKLLKEQFRASFGADAANVFLPQQSPGFDIVEAVKQIELECGGNKGVVHEQAK